MASNTQKGWYSRGYLPHLDAQNCLQSVTFRLADALPAEAIERMKSIEDPEVCRQQIEMLLDAGHGACLLARPPVAQIVADALHHFDGLHYGLLAWCVMPNHVHALFETRPEHPIAQVLHSWKSYTAKQINRVLGRSGPLWQREYFDRFIRDDAHLQVVMAYIENNPVKAGLVKNARDWLFSSAGARRGEEMPVPSLAVGCRQDAGAPIYEDAYAPREGDALGRQDAGAPREVVAPREGDALGRQDAGAPSSTGVPPLYEANDALLHCDGAPASCRHP